MYRPFLLLVAVSLSPSGESLRAQTREDTLAILRAWAQYPPVLRAKPDAPGYLLTVSIRGPAPTLRGTAQEILGQLCIADSSESLDITRFDIASDTVWIGFQTEKVRGRAAFGTAGEGRLERRRGVWTGIIIGSSHWDGEVVYVGDTAPGKPALAFVAPQRQSCTGSKR
jgi:hypothetical protein